MAIRSVGGPADRHTIILGTAQVTNGPTGPAHAATINRIAQELAESGDYEYITLNRSWGTATGRLSPHNTQPDIIAVRRDGRVEAYEVRSPSQTDAELRQRLEQEIMSLPFDRRGDFNVFNNDPS